MPWIELLVLLVVAYVVVLVVRGLIQVGPWFIETFVEPRQLARPKKNPNRQSDGRAVSRSRPLNRQTAARRSLTRKESLSPPWVPPPADGTARVSQESSYQKGLYVLGSLGPGRNRSRSKRVKCCSRALRLNPGYEPAWGLTANALVGI